MLCAEVKFILFYFLYWSGLPFPLCNHKVFANIYWLSSVWNSLPLSIFIADSCRIVYFSFFAAFLFHLKLIVLLYVFGQFSIKMFFELNIFLFNIFSISSFFIFNPLSEISPIAFYLALKSTFPGEIPTTPDKQMIPL